MHHLGHKLYNLNDDDDILLKSRHLSRAANCLFTTFSFLSPSPLSYLFSSFCLSLYGCVLWKLSSPALRGLEVTFNNCLRRIWNLPRNTHTGILHCCAGLFSIFNTVFSRSSKFLSRAANSNNMLVQAVFHDPSIYTFAGFNLQHGRTFLKEYPYDDIYCANVLRDFILSPTHYDICFGNSSTETMLRTIATS